MFLVSYATPESLRGYGPHRVGIVEPRPESSCQEGVSWSSSVGRDELTLFARARCPNMRPKKLERRREYMGEPERAYRDSEGFRKGFCACSSYLLLSCEARDVVVAWLSLRAIFGWLEDAYVPCRWLWLCCS